MAEAEPRPEQDPQEKESFLDQAPENTQETQDLYIESVLNYEDFEDQTSELSRDIVGKMHEIRVSEIFDEQLNRNRLIGEMNVGDQDKPNWMRFFVSRGEGLYKELKQKLKDPENSQLSKLGAYKITRNKNKPKDLIIEAGRNSKILDASRQLEQNKVLQDLFKDVVPDLTAINQDQRGQFDEPKTPYERILHLKKLGILKKKEGQ